MTANQKRLTLMPEGRVQVANGYENNISAPNDLINLGYLTLQ
jgi:hypothetical protein